MAELNRVFASILSAANEGSTREKRGAALEAVTRTVHRQKISKSRTMLYTRKAVQKRQRAADAQDACRATHQRAQQAS
jgi:hypothetical protein